MFSKKLMKIICVFVCIFSVTANSSTFNVEIDGDLDNMTSHGLSLDGNIGPAGVFNFEGTHVDNGNTTHLYCAELVQGITFGIHEFTQVELSAVHNKYHKAAWLMDTFSPYLDTPQSGAVQLAIWEVIHETSGVFDLYSGTFFLFFSFTLDFAIEIADITSTFLSMYDPDKDLSNYVVYQNATKQDTIGEKLDVTEVPEPNTLFLFMLTIGLLWLKGVKFR